MSNFLRGILFFLMSIGLAFSSENQYFFEFKTYSRFTFLINEDVSIQKKNTAHGFEIFLKNISLSDFYSLNQFFDSKLKSYEDSRIKSLHIQEKNNEIKISGIWKFPTGKFKLLNPLMDIYDYLEQTPSGGVVRYFFDFWIKKSPSIIESEIKKQRQLLSEKIKEKKSLKEKTEKKSHLYSEKSVEESFCRKFSSNKGHLPIRFYPAHRPFQFSKWFPSPFADSNYSYKIEDEDYIKKLSGVKKKEINYVQLAMNFFKKQEFSLAIKVISFLESEFPKSVFMNEIQFLKVNSFLRLKFFNQSEIMLKKIINTNKGSEIALQSALYLVGKLIEKKSFFQSLEQFFWLSRHYSEHDLNWIFHLGAAECLYELGQVQRAMQEYAWIKKNGRTPLIRSEAALRIGDLFQLKFAYDLSLIAYAEEENYLKINPDFAEYSLNKAEALYQLGKYDRSKVIFTNFLEKFPYSSLGWRATYRLGEISECMSSDSEEEKKWYYETINRYPFSLGAILSRMSLLPYGDHAGFDLKSAEKSFLSDDKSFDGLNDLKKEIVLSEYKKFRTVAYLHMLIEFKSFTEALNYSIKEKMYAISFYAFKMQISEFLKNKKNFELLNFYLTYIKELKKIGFVDENKNKLKIYEIAYSFGLSKTAEELSSYKDDFLVIKKKWIEKNSLLDKTDLPEVKKKLTALQVNYEFSYQRYLLLSLLEEKEGNINASLNYASQAQLYKKSKQLDNWIASLLFRLGKYKASFKIYQYLLNNWNNEKNEEIEEWIRFPSTPSFARVVLSQSEILRKQKKWKEVVDLFTEAVKKENDSPFFYEYYSVLAQIPTKKAKELGDYILKDLVKKSKNKKVDEFWGELAQEKIERGFFQ